jgi:hypothetical protein
MLKTRQAIYLFEMYEFSILNASAIYHMQRNENCLVICEIFKLII